MPSLVLIAMAKLAAAYACQRTSRGTENLSDQRSLTKNQKDDIANRVAASRYLTSSLKAALGNELFETTTFNERVSMEADIISRFGAGNCGEMATLAFDYLCRSTSHVVSLCVCHQGIGHEFVVVGVPRALSQTPTLGDLGNDDFLAVCDPWAGRAMLGGKPDQLGIGGYSPADYGSRVIEKCGIGQPEYPVTVVTTRQRGTDAQLLAFPRTKFGLRVQDVRDKLK